jgi:exportin-7
LSFDFIGTNPEDSSEDVGTIQVPSGWRPVVQDNVTMKVFFDCYRDSSPPRSNYALEAIVQLSSIRRSLFATDKERTIFLQFLMTNIIDIMKSKHGLESVDNYHEFCRLLGRLKASYQLSELVATVGFLEFLDLACEFTITSLLNWEYSMNSIHYLLALWGRLVAAIPYLRSEGGDSQRQGQLLRDCVLRVVFAYINTMLESVDRVVRGDGGVDDPLDDEGSLKDQMDRLPVIARLQYDMVAQHLIAAFESTLSQYSQAVTMSGMQTNRQLTQQLAILEGRMTWLVYMVAAVIGGQTVADARKTSSDLMWDGQLSRFVFQLVNILDNRLLNTNGKGKCDQKLEIGILNFFKHFKRVYIIESNLSPSSVVIGPSGASAHPLLSFALSYAGETADGMDNTHEASNVCSYRVV